MALFKHKLAQYSTVTFHMETSQSPDAELLVFLNTLTTTPHQQEWPTYTTGKPVYMDYKTAERLEVGWKCMAKNKSFEAFQKSASVEVTMCSRLLQR